MNMNGKAKGWIPGIFLIGFILALWGTFMRGKSSSVNETDYRAAAENFILNNANIAYTIGKVKRLDHFGDGGAGENVSYNVYRISGAENDAVCHVTLNRDENGHWKVTKAVLTLDGSDYIIPIQRAKPKDFRLF